MKQKYFICTILSASTLHSYAEYMITSYDRQSDRSEGEEGEKWFYCGSKRAQLTVQVILIYFKSKVT